MPLASKRAREKRSVGNRIIRLESQTNSTKSSDPAKYLETGSVDNESLSNGAVQKKNILPGSVGTEELGLIQEIISDDTLTLSAPRGLIVDAEGATSGGDLLNVSIGSVRIFVIDETGHIQAQHSPYAQAQGSVTITPSAANTATAASVTFPVNRFTVAPRVVAGVSSPLATVGSSAITTSGCTVTIIRSNTSNTVVTWIATQMTSSTADG